MKKFTLLIAFFAALLLAGAPQTDAAARKGANAADIQKAGTEVKTKYFELAIPDGWIMPQPVKQQPNDGVSAVFATEKGNVAITLNVMNVPMDAREIATQTAANMNKTGLKTTEPVENGGLWAIDIEGKAKGKAWFGSNGKICAVTTIFGADVKLADELLKAIKTENKGLFPNIK